MDASKLTGSLSLDTSGNAGSATQLETARTIGGVSFNGTANICLPGVNTAGDQDTSGNAATATSATNATNATNVSIDAENASATRYLAFVAGTSGNRDVRVDSHLTYNPSSNTLTAGTFSGSLSGNATGLTSVNKLQLTGDVTTAATSIGTGGTASMSVTVNDSSHKHGAVTKIFVQSSNQQMVYLLTICGLIRVHNGRTKEMERIILGAGP